ncbi:putative late blight resistance protein homolog R1B-16 [Andrographis paniculata]|uniref:putative late blight resistance protein homolog R1B-16 n=1 Tax=Andrographis paniculata TaxID=175694 RepID=UPI0021E79A3A|nr:putative late blight resistance protein homolog R1B-16 [Andrographis paniculata]
MAVAAYASLVSLTHVLDNVHYRAQLRHFHVDIEHIETLQESVNSLLKFVEVHSAKEGERIDGLWRQIPKVAFEAEEVFDFHVVNQLQLRSEVVKADLGLSAFNEDIDGAIQKFDFIMKELFVEEDAPKDFQFGKQPKVFELGGTSVEGASLTTPSRGKNTIVGFDGHVDAIVDLLTRDEPTLQIIPIVGMGGIGKTTLAKAVFDSQHIADRFDRRIWLTISQGYTVEDILSGLLNDGKVTTHDGNSGRLRDALYKELFGRPYLIVMDDVWSEQAWVDLRMCFPDNNNRSRVMMTTRLANVAGSLSSHNSYPMTFLDKNESWNLFCQTIFANEDFPYPELEKFGRKIVESCKGLPLEIIVIGGLLAKSDMSREYWKSVADNVSSYANFEGGEYCLKILSLSYNNLPIHLKPCFLFVSHYPEDWEIDAAELIEKWIANGLIRATNGKSLEVTATEYLEDLSVRNLVFMHKSRTDDGKKICGIHDLLRDLCLREFAKAQFIRSPRVQDIYRLGKQQCFLCSRPTSYENVIDVPEFVLLSPSQASPLSPPTICGACKMMYSHVTRGRLVEIMSRGNDHLDFLHPTQVRYLSVYTDIELIPILSNLRLLWNLQILKLFLQCRAVFPDEIWEMPQLRHLNVTNDDGAILPDPPVATHVRGEGTIILQQLQSLSEIWNFKCTKDVLDRIPDIKTLEIRYAYGVEESIGSSEYSLCNLVQLKNLQSLKISGAPENIAFPNSLKELYLIVCIFAIPWSSMSIIGSLPYLEKLELYYATKETEWNPVVGEFLRLKELSIEDRDLLQWRADKEHFPTLERLQLWLLRSLEEIPLGIGDIPTLRRIELSECSGSAMESAYQIWEEQQSIENDTIEILVKSEHQWCSISDFVSQLREDDDSK